MLPEGHLPSDVACNSGLSGRACNVLATLGSSSPTTTAVVPPFARGPPPPSVLPAAAAASRRRTSRASTAASQERSWLAAASRWDASSCAHCSVLSSSRTLRRSTAICDSRWRNWRRRALACGASALPVLDGLEGSPRKRASSVFSPRSCTRRAAASAPATSVPAGGVTAAGPSAAPVPALADGVRLLCGELAARAADTAVPRDWRGV